MKPLFLFLLFILPTFAFCDTLDYWSVYLNEEKIGDYNSVSNDNSINLNRDSVSTKDTLYIRYANDHPCVKCEYYFAAKESINGRKLFVQRRYSIPQTVAFPLKFMIEWTELKAFILFVYEDDWTGGENTYTVLLEVKIE